MSDECDTEGVGDEELMTFDVSESQLIKVEVQDPQAGTDENGLPYPLHTYINGGTGKFRLTVERGDD